MDWTMKIGNSSIKKTFRLKIDNSSISFAGILRVFLVGISSSTVSKSPGLNRTE